MLAEERHTGKQDKKMENKEGFCVVLKKLRCTMTKILQQISAFTFKPIKPSERENERGGVRVHK